MVCCIFIGLEFHYSPYAWRILQNLERLSLSTHTISLLLASLFQSNSFRSKERRWVVEVSITLVNIAFITYFVFITFYKYRKSKSCWFKKKLLKEETLSVDSYDTKDSIFFINPLFQVSTKENMKDSNGCIQLMPTKKKREKKGDIMNEV